MKSAYISLTARSHLPKDPIVWTEEYSVGVPLMDEQHSKLFSMIEDLRQCILHGSSRAEMAKILKSLVHYCNDHFECEELFMESIGFPMKHHAATHRRFTEQTLNWLKKFSEGKMQPEVILESLMDWLANHIHGGDKEYQHFCKQRGISTNHIVTFSDVFPKPTKKEKKEENIGMVRNWILEIYVATALFVCFVLQVFVSARMVVSRIDIIVLGVVELIIITINIATIYGIHVYLKDHKLSIQILHARQLADNLLANEIAARVASMNLDNIDNLFSDSDSPLMLELQNIVDNIRLYLPYLPSALVSMLKDQTEEIDYQVITNGKVMAAEGIPDVKPLPVRKDSNPLVKTTSYLAGIAIRSLSSSSFEGKIDACLATTPTLPNKATPKTPISPLMLEPAKDTITLSCITPTLMGHSSRPVSPVFSTGKESSKKEEGRSSYSKNRLTLSKSIQSKVISLLLVDLNQFHNYCRSNTLETIISFHTEFMTALDTLITGLRGVVNYFNGDHVLVTWNAANTVATHSALSCKAALEVHNCLLNVNRKYNTQLSAKVAVASGRAIVGNMGTSNRLSFGTIGEIVVAVHEICKLNNHLKTNTLICSETWKDVNINYLARYVGAIHVFQNELLYVLELCGYRAGDDAKEWMYAISFDDANDPYSKYNQAVTNYYQGNPAAAIPILKSYLESNRNDVAASSILQNAELSTSLTNSMSFTRIHSPLCWKHTWHS